MRRKPCTQSLLSLQQYLPLRLCWQRSSARRRLRCRELKRVELVWIFKRVSIGALRSVAPQAKRNRCSKIAQGDVTEWDADNDTASHDLNFYRLDPVLCSAKRSLLAHERAKDSLLAQRCFEADPLPSATKLQVYQGAPTCFSMRRFL